MTIRRILLALVLLIGSAASALADGTINSLANGAALSGGELLPMFQTANPAVVTTPTAIGNYIAGQTLTLTNKTLTSPAINGGAINSATVGATTPASGAFTTLGATSTITLSGLAAGTQVSCLGLNSVNQVVLLASACGSASTSFANPTATAGPTAINGLATTAMRSDAAPAIQLGSNTQLGLAEGDGKTISLTSGVASTIGHVVAGTTQTVTADQWLEGTIFYVTTASQTLTLPLSTGLSTGGGIFIQTIGQSVTLAPNALDSINGGTAGASVTIAAGLTAFVTTDAANHIYASPTTAGTSSGCVPSGSATQLLTNSGAGACTSNSNATLSSTLLTLTSTGLSFTGNTSAAAWLTTGLRLRGGGATLTDTTSSGTVAAAYTNVLGGNTIAASIATTYTNYYEMFFGLPTAGTNVTLTNAWSVGGAKFNATTGYYLNGTAYPTPANIAQLNVNEAFTAGQAVTPDTSASCGTIATGGTATPNFANSNSCQLTFGIGVSATMTIANPTNAKIGQDYLITIAQNTSGSGTVSWGVNYDFGTAGAPTLTTTASKIDDVSCYAYTTSSFHCAVMGKGF